MDTGLLPSLSNRTGSISVPQLLQKGKPVLLARRFEGLAGHTTESHILVP